MLLLFLDVCLLKNNPTSEQKQTTKTLVSYCCLPCVPGRVLPRERPTKKKKKLKVCFIPPSFFSLLCFISFVFCFVFYLSSFASVFLLFYFFHLFFFFSLSFEFERSSTSKRDNEKNQRQEDNISNKKKTNKKITGGKTKKKDNKCQTLPPNKKRC